MDVRAYLIEQLQSQDNCYSKAFSDSASGKSLLPDVSSLGLEVQGKIDIPLLQSQFIMQIDLPNMESKPMLLKSFNLPEVGVQYDMSAENMWFPTPTVVANKFKIEGYMYYNDYQSSILALYKNQFKGGLLNIGGVCPSLTLSQIRIFEDFDASLEVFGAATTALNAIVAGVTQDWAALGVTAAADATDIISDAKVFSKLMKDKKTGFEVNPLFKFDRCRFSHPSINIDQASNEFTVITMEVAYKEMIFQ